jgi:hypothetical protein
VGAECHLRVRKSPARAPDEGAFSPTSLPDTGQVVQPHLSLSTFIAYSSTPSPLRSISHTRQPPKTTADVSHQAGDIRTQATASEQRIGSAATVVATSVDRLKVAILPDGTCSLAQVLSPTTALVASEPSTTPLDFFCSMKTATSA